jgi:hypothetical protein
VLAVNLIPTNRQISRIDHKLDLNARIFFAGFDLIGVCFQTCTEWKRRNLRHLAFGLDKRLFLPYNSHRNLNLCSRARLPPGALLLNGPLLRFRLTLGKPLGYGRLSPADTPR